ncbi:peptide/nickel transport system permease protein [Pseudonocardia thermophila]|uniref:Peptide/nickel transport system permease protein n=1 Tax=Pseudonocardia thermophila TaxID=1848 RepID=A0A1M6UH67_PSETH|nr:ABC transporter permease [Pseudonocardia thermophila]SHK68554.1 peptide/nickel transport system permease protein [Pseudonocardia thermophila]
MTTLSPAPVPVDRPVAASALPNRSPMRTAARAFFRSPAALSALAFLALLLFLAVAAPLVVPYDPAAQNLANRFSGPSAEHWLGTDEFGRDVLSRMMTAAQIALVAPLIAVGTAAVIGVPTALLAGLRRGAIDAVAGRLADAVMSLPALALAMAIIAILGPGLVNSMIAVGIAFAPSLFRVVRGAALATSRETFMESAESIGCTTRRMVWVHLLPNVAAPMLVQVTILMGVALLAEAGLSFIGLGVQPPDSSWGSMLADAYQNQFRDPFGAVAPGAALALTVLCFNVLGDTLRDVIAAGRRA